MPRTAVIQHQSMSRSKATTGARTRSAQSTTLRRQSHVYISRRGIYLQCRAGKSKKSGDASSFLSAFDKIQEAAALDKDEEEREALDEESVSQGADKQHDDDEHVELVSELLAAAGLSDDGLPLYFEGGGAAGVAISHEDDDDQDDKKKNGEKGGRRGRRARRADDSSFGGNSKIPDALLPRVAIVGRPNVGKSALFNRIVGKQVAIVFDYPGVTRDRLYTRGFWMDREFMLVDTGGLMSEAAALPREQQLAAMQSLSADGLPMAIERQAAAAVDEADAVILVVDGQMGPTAVDEEVLSWLRKAHPGKPVSLAVNKCENVGKADEQAAEFWATGLEPFAVSAISGSGTFNFFYICRYIYLAYYIILNNFA